MSDVTNNKSNLVFKVTLLSPELIPSARLTPYEIKELSDIDDQEVLRVMALAIFFYRNNELGQDPAKVVKVAVTKALVPYYPLAGRLRGTKGRNLVVECTGEGIMLVEADAEVTLDDSGEPLHPPFPCIGSWFIDVGALDNLNLILVDESLLHEEGSLHSLDPIYKVQAMGMVTRLRCGGFILAININHVMVDGLGVVQFMKAVSELARGATFLTVQPAWKRHLLKARDSPQVTCVHHEYNEVPEIKSITLPFDDIVHKCFFGQKEIGALRGLLPQHLKFSTRFEIIIACLWRCRTLSLGLGPDEEVWLRFMVNTRFTPKLDLPKGYYGNALVYPVAISTPSKLSTDRLGYAVELIKKAKASVTAENVQSSIYLLVAQGKPFPARSRVFIVSDMSQARYSKLDFGWGPPIYSGLGDGQLGAVLGVGCYYMSYKTSKGESGIMVPFCLPRRAMQTFTRELTGLLSDVPQHPIANPRSSL